MCVDIVNEQDTLLTIRRILIRCCALRRYFWFSKPIQDILRACDLWLPRNTLDELLFIKRFLQIFDSELSSLLFSILLTDLSCNSCFFRLRSLWSRNLTTVTQIIVAKITVYYNAAPVDRLQSVTPAPMHPTTIHLNMPKCQASATRILRKTRALSIIDPPQDCRAGGIYGPSFITTKARSVANRRRNIMLTLLRQSGNELPFPLKERNCNYL